MLHEFKKGKRKHKARNSIEPGLAHSQCSCIFTEMETRSDSRKEGRFFSSPFLPKMNICICPSVRLSVCARLSSLPPLILAGSNLISKIAAATTSALIPSYDALRICTCSGCMMVGSCARQQHLVV